MTDKSQSMTDKSQSMIDKSQSMTDKSQSMIDKSQSMTRQRIADLQLQQFDVFNIDNMQRMYKVSN